MAEYNIKQVIVIRKKYPDGRGGQYKPRKGKLIAQGAHASMKVFFDLGTVGRWGPMAGPTFLKVPLTPEMQEWVTGSFAKIVVGVDTEEELHELHAAAIRAGLPCAIIQDLGNTEFKGIPTYTALAIGPAKKEDLDPITGSLSLL